MKAELEHLIFKQGEGAVFYDFSNADGKRWLMPARHMHTAMQLYQPGGLKGKLLKQLFPILHHLPPVRRVLHAERLRLALCPQLCALLNGVFPGGCLEWAVFCGTLSVHRKYTLQLSCGKKILGYCKLTGSDEVAGLFRKEAVLLQELAERGMPESSLPRALLCERTEEEGPTLFVQSTVKSEHSRMIHTWGAIHEDYLKRLHECTKQCLPFEKTDYAFTLSEGEKHLDWVPNLPGKECLTGIVERIRSRYAGRHVEFSVYHADFTPWNMFEEEGQLFVFDWEYARRTYPPGLDRYHFYTQSAIFERRLGLESMLAEFSSTPQMLREEYLTYLLDVIFRFAMREQGRVEGDMAHSFDIWLKLIRELSR